MTKLNFYYDDRKDLMTIEGINYSGDLFRAWGEGGMELGTLFRITDRKDGVISVERVEENKKEKQCQM